eukprot:scaffold17375_cov102-Isochrysis_galbana.AAC.2
MTRRSTNCPEQTGHSPSPSPFYPYPHPFSLLRPLLLLRGDGSKAKLRAPQQPGFADYDYGLWMMDEQSNNWRSFVGLANCPRGPGAQWPVASGVQSCRGHSMAHGVG